MRAKRKVLVAVSVNVKSGLHARSNEEEEDLLLLSH